jgi:hypothetical protein
MNKVEFSPSLMTMDLDKFKQQIFVHSNFQLFLSDYLVDVFENFSNSLYSDVDTSLTGNNMEALVEKEEEEINLEDIQIF